MGKCVRYTDGLMLVFTEKSNCDQVESSWILTKYLLVHTWMSS